MEPTSSVNVDEVVALGAALYAAYKSDRTHLSITQKAAVSAIKFSEITNFCFGTIIARYDENRAKRITANTVLIKKNEPIPCSVTESFYTVSDGQDSVRCVVTQSIAPESDPRFVKTIWEGNLSLPPGRPSNQEIRVNFGFDANNVMMCKFEDVATRKEVKVDLRPEAQNGQTTNINKFLVD
jgi:molecular chaperone DnaK